jgi:hypothetical protein
MAKFERVDDKGKYLKWERTDKSVVEITPVDDGPMVFQRDREELRSLIYDFFIANGCIDKIVINFTELEVIKDAKV